MCPPFSTHLEGLIRGKDGCLIAKPQVCLLFRSQDPGALFSSTQPFAKLPFALSLGPKDWSVPSPEIPLAPLAPSGVILICRPGGVGKR